MKLQSTHENRVSTRWGSRQAMIERITTAKAIHMSCPGQESRHLIPTWQDMDDDELTCQEQSSLKILEYLNEKYRGPDIQALLDMASRVDPRFKMRYTAEDNKITIQFRLKDEMQTLAMMMPPQETAQETSEEGAEAGCAPKKKMLLEATLKLLNKPCHLTTRNPV
ncbi:hypothetical protein QQF64_017024 [Cirrhinus molitorella]|uniref:Uncharacterized protein n=1 Tax=Cirrhinus molitorella TaxID=172907 RepID=A0ABR3LJV7_9TELE